MRYWPLIVASALALLAPGLALAGDLMVIQPEIRASIGKSPNTAAYLTLENHGAAPDRLLSARCACAGMVMIHQTKMANGMAMMGDAAAVVVPAHGAVAFKPEGLHLMVMGLKAPLVDGADQPLTLVFERAGAMKIAFKVKSHIGAADSAPAPSSMDAMPGMGR